MKILITGMNGFLGRNFIQYSNLDCETYALVRGNYPVPNHVKVIRGDIEDIDTLGKIKSEKFSHIFHFAWSGLPDLSNENNFKNYVSQMKFYKMLEGCNSRIQVMGSCLEYGKLNQRVTENTLPLEPNNFGETKNRIRTELELLDLDINWYRIFYAFGAFQHNNSLLRHAYKAFSLGEIPVLSSASNFYDFIPASAACQAIAEISKMQSNSNIYNVGTGNLTSVASLCNELAKQMKSNLRLEEPPNGSGLIADSVEPTPNGICQTSIEDEISIFLKSVDSNS